MHEIIPDVVTWAWFSQPHGYDFNGHLVRHPAGNLLIDPVMSGDAELDELTRSGAATIVLTNRNHSRAANLLRSRTGARTLIHPGDAAHARAQGTEIDGSLVIGETVGPFSVVDASGKSPGEIALHWPERGVLVVGDAVIGNPPGSCALPRAKVVDDLLQLRRNVARLLDLDFDTLLVGDGVPILSAAKRRLQELATTFPAARE